MLKSRYTTKYIAIKLYLIIFDIFTHLLNWLFQKP
jgi:hypothetical protein